MSDMRPLLEAAIRAPSGDNAQPWRFVVYEKEKIIDILLDPEADTSFYNYGEHAAYLALGACVENIYTAASALGFTAEVTAFPDPSREHLVARVVCAPCVANKHPRSDAIAKRVTNRHPYTASPLSEAMCARLVHAGTTNSTQVHLTTDRKDATSIGQIGATNEYIMLGAEKLHQFFFEHINWTSAEDAEKRTGFFVESLALPPPALVGFKVARSWKRCALLNRLVQFNRIVATQNAALYAQAGAFCCITTTEETPQAAFEAGRAFEACWLEAESQGLSVQPLMGTLFLRFAARAGESGGLGQEARAHIEEAMSQLQKIFEYADRKPYALFRVGETTKRMVHTRRRAVEDVTEWHLA